MHEYLSLLHECLVFGNGKGDRTGTGVRSLFGRQIHFDLSKGFPLLTTKKLFTRAIVHELLWMLSGDTNIKYLNDNGVSIWDEWAKDDGSLGPVYGAQWRKWPGYRYEGGLLASKFSESHSPRFVPYPIDQITDVVDQIKNNPNSRRLIVSAWNPADIPDMALAPCHCLFQFYVADGKLSCQLYQRSADIFLGVPFNIASYALLTHMIAQVTGLRVGEFIHTFGDVHLYENHVEQAKLQVEREPRDLPRLVLNPEVNDLFSFKFEDVVFENYNPHPKIEAPIAV